VVGIIGLHIGVILLPVLINKLQFGKGIKTIMEEIAAWVGRIT